MMGNYHVRCGVGEKPEMATSEAYLSLFSLPDDFDKILSVMRSRGVSVSIILQNPAESGAAEGTVRKAVGKHRRQY